MVLVQGLVAQGLKPVSTAGWFQVQFMFFNGSSSRVGSPRSQTSFYKRLIPSPIPSFFNVQTLWSRHMRTCPKPEINLLVITSSDQSHSFCVSFGFAVTDTAVTYKV
jgi:hypothetical protein